MKFPSTSSVIELYWEIINWLLKYLWGLTQQYMVCPMKHEQLGNFTSRDAFLQWEDPGPSSHDSTYQSYLDILENCYEFLGRSQVFFFFFFSTVPSFFIFSLPHKYPSLISKLLKEISEVLLQLSEQINASLGGTEVGDVKDPKHS